MHDQKTPAPKSEAFTLIPWTDVLNARSTKPRTPEQIAADQARDDRFSAAVERL